MPKPKKAILVTFRGNANAGGAERMTMYLGDYLQSRGIQTEILDEKRLMRSMAGGLLTWLLKYRHFQKRKEIYLGRLASVYLWKQWRPRSIVFSNGESTPFYPADYAVSHGCYHVMEQAYGRKEPSLSRVARYQQFGLKRSRQIVTVADHVKKQLVETYLLDPAKIEIVSNGVDTDHFKPLPKTGGGARTLLYVGRLEEGKGLKVLLNLAEIIEASSVWRLLIASNHARNTDLFSPFKKTSIKVGLTLENINAEAYSQADLVIFPSKYESFGMVTIEALASGIPVVGTPVGILPVLIEEGYPGVHLLSANHDASGLDEFEHIVRDFTSVDRQALHESIKDQFGLERYRRAWDAVLSKRFTL